MARKVGAKLSTSTSLPITDHAREEGGGKSVLEMEGETARSDFDVTQAFDQARVVAV